MTDANDSQPTTRYTLLLILGWVLLWASLAAVLRALWLDETFSVLRSQGSLSKVLTINRGAEANPPLYQLLMYFWLGLGDSAFQSMIASRITAAS